MQLKREKPPNPNGNPNFKKLWGNLGEAKAIRLPESLHSLFRSLSTAINSGKIKVTDLENMCIDWGNVERELTAITGSKTHLEIVPDPVGRGETLTEAKERADHYQALYREKLQELEFFSEQIKKSDRREKLDEALAQEMQLIDKFEQLQAKSWGSNPNQRGEFKTSSRSWDKYHEFKAWLAKQGEN